MSRLVEPKLTRNAYRDDPDVGLMLRVQCDDGAAFAELTERYRARVYGHFVKCLGDRQEAEDLTQEAFLRLFRGRKRYQPRARFATWLYHITHNLTCNAIRSRRRRALVHCHSRDAHDRATVWDRAPVACDASPSRPLERAEVADAVRGAVRDLAGRQRAAVELHQFHDRTYAEVAAELDMTPKAAKSLLYRARGQLRVSLAAFVGMQG
jgi:RNA polymerase sigma-70 factor (ECF subfamily)